MEIHKATPEEMALAKAIAIKIIDQANDPKLLLYAVKIVEQSLKEYFEKEKNFKITAIDVTPIDETPNEVITHHDA